MRKTHPFWCSNHHEFWATSPIFDGSNVDFAWWKIHTFSVKNRWFDVYIMLNPSFSLQFSYLSWLTTPIFSPFSPGKAAIFPPVPGCTAPRMNSAEPRRSRARGALAITRPPTLTRLSAQPRKSCSRRSWGVDHPKAIEIVDLPIKNGDFP